MVALNNYKPLLAIPIALLLVSVFILVSGFMQTGEWFERSIDLKGGTLVTLNSDTPLDILTIENELKQEFGQVLVRELRSFSGYGVSIELDSEVEPDSVIAVLEGLGIDTTDSSTETIGPALGASFWFQAQLAIVFAFVLMGIIVFIIFRIAIPSIAVILAALSDIIITLALMQVFNIELSLASLAALLMLIGYSIDTDIMLTTRILKTEGEIGERVKSAFKTGITMTGTSIGALVALLLTSLSPVLVQIASVLLIGLIIDIINTWLQNSVLLRWYCERRGIA